MAFTMAHHKRHHSWPPLGLQGFTRAQDINDNPFAFFISAPGYPEDDSLEYMDANIESAPRARSSSPAGRRRYVNRARGWFAVNRAILKMHRWIQRMEQRYRTRPPYVMAEGPARPISPPPPVPKTVVRNRRRRMNKDIGVNHGVSARVRSHSVRPRIWRTPGSEIWTVPENEQIDVKPQIMPSSGWETCEEDW